MHKQSVKQGPDINNFFPVSAFTEGSPDLVLSNTSWSHKSWTTSNTVSEYQQEHVGQGIAPGCWKYGSVTEMKLNMDKCYKKGWEKALSHALSSHII